MSEKIISAVKASRKEAVGFLQKLLAFDTQVIDQGVGGSEGSAQRFLAAELKRLGAAVDLFEPDNKRLKKYADFNPGHNYRGRPNLVATLGGGRKSIILNGHIDTVSPGNPALWKCDPWQGRIAGGRLFGLGSCDMKGGLAAMIMAVKLLRKLAVPLDGKIIIQSVVDEEGGGNGSLACVDRGYKADVALIAEPTNMAICAAHRGAMHLKLTARGLSTHASLKEKGVNAIEKMVRIMHALENLETQWHRRKKHSLLPSPAITFCQLSGGVGASIIPAECEAKVNVKYLPGEDPVVVRQEVAKCVRQACRNDPWLRKHQVELSWLLNTSPYETNCSHPIVGILKNSLTTIRGKFELSGMPSGSDARTLNNVGHIPTFIIGPGDLSMAHQPNENLPLADYFDAITMFAVTINKWLGGC